MYHKTLIESPESLNSFTIFPLTFFETDNAQTDRFLLLLLDFVERFLTNSLAKLLK